MNENNVLNGAAAFETTETQAIYDQSAQDYFRARSTDDLFNNEAQLKMIKTIKKPPASVLDLGSGDGYIARWFCGYGYKYVGIEQSAEMLKIARREAPPAANFIFGDMAGEGFRVAKSHEPFQIVVSFYALLHLAIDAQRALFSQVFEAMSGEGLFYFTIMSTDLIKEQYPDHPTPDRFSGWYCFHGTMYPYARVSDDEYRSILANIGFADVTIDNVTTKPGTAFAETMPWILCRKPRLNAASS
jgi:SAM-dependent methyltransferase